MNARVKELLAQIRANVDELDTLVVEPESPPAMKTSAQAIALLKSERIEGVRYVAYLDGGGVPTIGAGHTKGVKLGDHIDDAQVDAFLREDLGEAEDAINRLVKIKLLQHQFDALVMLVFNIGVQAFRDSTLLKLLNAFDIAGAADQFSRWKFDNGRVVKGLVNRRAIERALFLTGIYD
jgi:lysozyme